METAMNELNRLTDLKEARSQRTNKNIGRADGDWLIAQADELDSLRNFMEQRRGRPVEMVAGAAIAEVERLEAEIKYMKSGSKDMSAKKAAALKGYSDE